MKQYAEIQCSLPGKLSSVNVDNAESIQGASL